MWPYIFGGKNWDFLCDELPRPAEKPPPP